MTRLIVRYILAVFILIGSLSAQMPIGGSGGGSGGGGVWGTITGTLSSQTDLNTALNAKVPTSTTVAGHALSGNVTIACADLTVACVTAVVHNFGATFDGGGSPLSAGGTAYATITYACTIQAWNIAVDAGTATVDIWKIAAGSAIPTVANTITASATPAIASGTAVHSTTLTSWTTSVSQNDIIAINLKTVSGATKVNLSVQCNGTN